MPRPVAKVYEKGGLQQPMQTGISEQWSTTWVSLLCFLLHTSLIPLFKPLLLSAFDLIEKGFLNCTLQFISVNRKEKDFPYLPSDWACECLSPSSRYCSWAKMMLLRNSCTEDPSFTLPSLAWLEQTAAHLPQAPKYIYIFPICTTQFAAAFKECRPATWHHAVL